MVALLEGLGYSIPVKKYFRRSEEQYEYRYLFPTLSRVFRVLIPFQIYQIKNRSELWLSEKQINKKNVLFNYQFQSIFIHLHKHSQGAKYKIIPCLSFRKTFIVIGQKETLVKRCAKKSTQDIYLSQLQQFGLSTNAYFS